VLGDLDGDGTLEVAFGAPGDDDSVNNGGAVYVLSLNADGTASATRKLSNLSGGLGFTLDNGDHFGDAVEALDDLDGDGVPELVVGAPEDDDGGTDRGAVYVLFLDATVGVKSSQKISQTSGLFTPMLEDFGEFGDGLASLGDLDGDGQPELAVGQGGGSSPTGSREGRVWLLSLFPQGLVAGFETLDADTPGLGIDLGSGDLFGASVDAIGDLNGDGVTDLAVGAESHGAFPAFTGKGAVVLAYLNADGTLRSSDVIAPLKGGLQANLGVHDKFGSALAFLGDLDGDGTQELVVGAYFDDSAATDDGAVHVLSLDYCPTQASATSRNAGTNPTSYTCDAPVLGQPWNATVDLSTTGHPLALVVGFTTPFQFTLPGGQTVLVIDGSGAGEQLMLAAGSGPTASFSLTVPLDSVFCGRELYTQAVHLGGGLPFALSNAQDLVVGH